MNRFVKGIFEQAGIQTERERLYSSFGLPEFRIKDLAALDL